jgi:putative endonuclease
MKCFYYTYLLKSEKDGKFYVGYTKDLNVRFEQHQKGLVTSTKHRLPFKLIYFEACLSQKDAILREKYLKTYYGKMHIAKRLKSYFTSQGQNNIITNE